MTAAVLNLLYYVVGWDEGVAQVSLVVLIKILRDWSLTIVYTSLMQKKNF